MLAWYQLNLVQAALFIMKLIHLTLKIPNYSLWWVVIFSAVHTLLDPSWKFVKSLLISRLSYLKTSSVLCWPIVIFKNRKSIWFCCRKLRTNLVYYCSVFIVAFKYLFTVLLFTLHKKWSFPLRISSVNVTKFTDLVTFTEETFNGKLQFLCSVETLSNIFDGTVFSKCSITDFRSQGPKCALV